MPLCLVKKRLLLIRLLILWSLLMPSALGLADESPVELKQLPSDPREALRQAGVSSFTKGALANIVIRGYQRENLMVTLDGSPYFGATPFRIDAAPFLLQNTDISKIVVTKGPYNLAVPGGLGGSVEVSTPDNPERISGKTSFLYGSYDAMDGRAFVSSGNQKADFSAGYLGRYSGVPEAGDGVPFTRTAYPNKNNNYRFGSEDLPMYRIDSFWLKGGVNLPGDSRVDLLYAYLQGNDIKVPTMNFDVSDEQIHRLNSTFKIRNITSMIREIALQGWWSHARTLLDDSLRETADPANTGLPYRNFLSRSYAMSNRFEVDTVGGRITARLALGPGELKSGVDCYQRNWNGTYSSLLNYGTPAKPDFRYNDGNNSVLIPDVTTRNLGVFGIYELPLVTSLRSVLSMRGDISTIDAGGLVAGRVANFYQPYYPGWVIPRGRDFTGWSANAQLFWQVRPELELFLKGGACNPYT